MAKTKYIIKDEDGTETEVVEIDNEKEKVEEPGTEVKDDDTLTAEDIKALKGLAAVASDLMKLVAKEDAGTGTTDEDPAKDPEEEADDEDDDDNDDGLTDCGASVGPMKGQDSKKSAGSIEKKKVTVDDSLAEDDIESAWAKRYQGGNN